jgi:hypothetical protein
MKKRTCYNCNSYIPPETEHYVFGDNEYCTDCVTTSSYWSYVYYVDGEYMGDSNDDDSKHVESYEDEYEEEEE